MALPSARNTSRCPTTDLREASHEERGRYVGRLQVERGDFNGRVFTVRADDMTALAWVLGCDERSFSVRLESLGICTSGL